MEAVAGAGAGGHAVPGSLVGHAEAYGRFPTGQCPRVADPSGRRRREVEKKPRALSDHELEILVARVEGWVHGRKGHAPRGEYLPALLAVSLDSGGRISDSVGISLPQSLLEESGRYVVVLGGAVRHSTVRRLHRNESTKTGLTEHVPMWLSDETSRLPKEHLGRQEDPAQVRLFPSATGRLLASSNVRRALMGDPVRGKPGVRAGGAVR